MGMLLDISLDLGLAGFQMFNQQVLYLEIERWAVKSTNSKSFFVSALFSEC